MAITAVAWFLAALAFLGMLAIFAKRRQRTRALAKIVVILERLRKGDLQARVSELPGAAVGDLAQAVNALAGDLAARAGERQREAAWFDALAARMEEGVLIADSQDRVALMNAAARSRFAPGSEPSRTIFVNSILKPAEALAVYQESRRENALVRRQVRVAGPVRTLTMEMAVAPIDAAAPGSGMLLLFRDLTEIVQNTQMKTDFVANASHELRTPLASIRAAVETINEAGIEDHQTVARCVDIIGGHALRLQMLVQDLLDLSRTEDARAMVRSDRIDLREAAEFIMATFGAAAVEKQIALNTDIAPDARVFRGDERLIMLILKNLVDNSMKFTSAGHVSIRARRVSTGMGATLQLEVADTGCGIPAEDQQRVFERFYTVNRSRGGAVRGTGLGLAIVKHAVGAMGGGVELHSEPGRGATVRCMLPIPDDNTPEQNGQAATSAV